LGWTAVVAPLVGVSAYLGISVLVADLLTRSANRAIELDPKVVAATAVSWNTQTDDQLTLRGWYCPALTHRRLIVLVHGLRSAWPEMAAVGHELHRLGYDVLVFDLRGHGQSDPARLSLGRHEQRDLRAVLSWAVRQGYSPDRIGWLGNSMGASTVMMEAAHNPAIRAAVVDSPYGNLPELLNAQLSEHSHLPHWFNPGILAAARLIFGVRTDDLVPIRSARHWGRRPLLLFHGEADTVVPVQQARQLAAAAGPWCRAVILPGIEHVQTYTIHPRRYIATVDAFFRQHLSP
jgi:dipeptidyl aminopeptidase/acylaminoacyl peptidase